MPRKTAQERHVGSTPAADRTWPPEGVALVDALMALHHPARRRLHELLTTGGPASVGQLARRTGMAVGSVSHHLKALHRAGFIEPANGLARDTRESWWRGVRRTFSWAVDGFEEGTTGRAVAELAEQANFEHQSRATVAWIRTRDELPEPWNGLGYAIGNLVQATPEQFARLETLIGDVVLEWDAQCRADIVEHPDDERRPVRFIARLYPSDPAAS